MGHNGDLVVYGVAETSREYVHSIEWRVIWAIMLMLSGQSNWFFKYTTNINWLKINLLVWCRKMCDNHGENLA